MNKTFEQYLIMVGAYSEEFDIPYETLLEVRSLDHFKLCHKNKMSAYKALVTLTLLEDE